jgi:surfeit locus 1 family protein
VLGALFIYLGTWQLSRVAEKRAFFAAFDAGSASIPAPAPTGEPGPETQRYRAIRATGHYDVVHQILLDSRTRNGRAGYEVLTPLVRDGGRAVLVNRGWIPADPDRSRLPDIAVGAAERTVTGLLDHLPRAALASAPPAIGSNEGWPRRLLFPTAAQLAANLGYAVEDYQLLLDSVEPEGFDRQWRPAVMTAQQHLGYAVQWFALATALVVIYAVLGFRKQVPNHE